MDTAPPYELEFLLRVCFNAGASDEPPRDEAHDRLAALEIDLEEVLCLEETGPSCEPAVDSTPWCEDI